MAGPDDIVLVTESSGFIAAHCIVALLNKGYRVRTSVRSLDRADDVRESLRNGNISEKEIQAVEFCTLDLFKDDGWLEACKGCKYVLHIASPFPDTTPKDENDLIAPARDGTLRALRAAKEAGTVKRVVVTASTAAITYGHPHSRAAEGPFTEEDWTRVDDPVTSIPTYAKSKAIADQAAWEWYRANSGEMEMSAIYPCGTYGPLLSNHFATSVSMVKILLNGELPLIPQITFGCVDVRDVAALHVLAMERSEAVGERFLAVQDEYIDVPGMAALLRRKLGDRARKVPTMLAPNWLLRLVGWFDPTVGGLAVDLGKRKEESNKKAKYTLGWRPRSGEEALLASAMGLERFGLLKG